MSKEKKTEATEEKQGQNIQRAAPASMFRPFDEMDHWFEGAFPASWR